MQQSRVDPDNELRATDQLCDLIKRRTIRHAGARHLAGDTVAAYTLEFISPGQQQLKPLALSEHPSERNPMRLRPLLLGSRGRVQQHSVARRTAGKAGSIEPEVWGTLRHVAECQPAQDPVSLDRVQVSVDAMAHIIKK